MVLDDLLEADYYNIVPAFLALVSKFRPIVKAITIPSIIPREMPKDLSKLDRKITPNKIPKAEPIVIPILVK